MRVLNVMKHKFYFSSPITRTKRTNREVGSFLFIYLQFYKRLEPSALHSCGARKPISLGARIAFRPRCFVLRASSSTGRARNLTHHSHQKNKTYLYGGSYLFFVCMMGLEVGAVVNDSPVDCQSRE